MENLFYNENICYQINPKIYNCGTSYLDVGLFFKKINDLKIDDDSVILYFINSIRESLNISKKYSGGKYCNIIIDCKNLNFSISKLYLIRKIIKKSLETFDNQLNELYVINNSSFFEIILTCVGCIIPKITKDKIYYLKNNIKTKVYQTK